MTVAGPTSCKGLLSLLRETDTPIIQFALRKLNDVVDDYWYEASQDVTLLEELSESTNLPPQTQQLAALIASRVYFNLGEYSDSMAFALKSGPLFHNEDRTLYTNTILGQCIDQYIHHREAGTEIDPALEKLFNSLASQWQRKDGETHHRKELIGFTIRARRVDLLTDILTRDMSQGSAELLSYTLTTALTYVGDIELRRSIIGTLVQLYSKDLKSIDHNALLHCLVFLGDHARMGEVLSDLVEKKSLVLVNQLCFDLFSYAPQDFLLQIESRIAESQRSGSVDPTVAQRMLSILRGQVTCANITKFLYSRCRSDIHVLNQVKRSLDPKNTITHNATVLTNALMYAGTTIDGFLRDNLNWLDRASHWAKFTVAASIGVIHRGHFDKAMHILSPYLPKSSVGEQPYSEAGSLMALGLIYSPCGAHVNDEAVKYLMDAIKKYAASEQMVHGGSLGLGLSAMCLNDDAIFDQLFSSVTNSSAVGGEGAALAIGMVKLGTADAAKIEMLKRHAAEYDQKEKTIRGLSMAIGLMMMGREGDADVLIKELSSHQDHWLRLGACFTIALAYAGTGNTKALEMLMNIAVRDTSDDVRRNAVTMIGIVSFKSPQQCNEITKALRDSYNPHIRYGVAMALGIAAGGTGDSDIIEALWQLKDDVIDFVRQGAYVALAMVMMQLSEVENPKVRELRQILPKKIGDRKEDVCTKFGCILALGLLDAGGRNSTMSLHLNGHTVTKAVVGAFIFSQYWYWYPYVLFISLTFQPTCIIALNDDLNLVKFDVISDAPPTRFAPPKSVATERKETKGAGTAKAVLSTQRKELDRLRRRGTSESLTDSTKQLVPKDDAAEAPPPAFETLSNPIRITKRQLSVIRIPADSRFKPLRQGVLGICMVIDTDPTAGDVHLVEEIDPMQKDEVPPPEPFPWP